MKKRYLILILIFLSFISIFIGVSDIKISDLFLLDNEKVNILLISRIPRLISIITAGMAMSVSGIIMQQISNNKFISPTTAATIDSAKFGVLVSMLIFTGATLFQKMVVSFIFSILGTVIFMKILKAIKLKNSIFIPLIGIMLGNVISSTTDFFAYKYDLIQNMNSFLQGDFSSVLKGNYELILFTIPIL
ncbi:MAG: iron chelate uptake ABC transporter family permease subunit, partial [Clostridium sp.]